MKEKVQYSVVIPVYNSFNSIEQVTDRIIHTFEKNNLYFEIILVDDYSEDDSLLKLYELSNKDKRIKVISLNNNSGQQKATIIGIKTAAGEFIITMDDDLEHKPEDIAGLISKINKGYDVVYGITRDKSYSFYRKAGSRLVNCFFDFFLNKPKSIRISSFRIIRREVADKLLEDSTPFVYISAMIFKITGNIGNIEVKAGVRKYGTSNYNIFKLMKLFFKLLFYYGCKRKKFGNTGNRRKSCDY